MRVTPEQVANLLFAVSQLRYFEQQYQIDRDIKINDIIIRYQCKIDDVLCLMGVDGYISRKQLLETIKLEYNANTNTEKESSRVENAI